MKNLPTHDVPDPVVDELLRDNTSLLAGDCALIIGEQATWVGDRISQFMPQTSCKALSFDKACQIFIDKPDRSANDNNRWCVAVLLQMKCDRSQKKSIGALLSRLRDVHADRVLHIVFSEDEHSETGPYWSLADSLQMGFSLVQKIQRGGGITSLYEYSIRDYKTSPDWLNSRHWAHPHLWIQ